MEKFLVVQRRCMKLDLVLMKVLEESRRYVE